MKTTRYGAWTRSPNGRTPRGRTPRQKTAYYKGRRRLGRPLFLLLGVALVLVSGFFLATETRLLGGSLPPPKDETLRLTVPKMARVKGVPVYTAAANDNASLDAGAIHLRGTGYPWEAGSNVYIAGHRLGYPQTGSFLLFYDINKLQAGDRVILKDTADRRYVYEVFDKKVVAPDDLSVTEPVWGRSIVSLQACTLPDYSRRIVVQARMVS